jgi:hypothetical protein
VEGWCWGFGPNSCRRPAARVVVGRILTVFHSGAELAPVDVGARRANHHVNRAAVWHSPRRGQRAQHSAGAAGPVRHYD